MATQKSKRNRNAGKSTGKSESANTSLKILKPEQRRMPITKNIIQPEPARNTEQN